jgi:hypothetical protein
MTLAGARRAYLVYLGQEAAGSFWFMMVITASGLFMIQDAHLDALQLAHPGGILEQRRGIIGPGGVARRGKTEVGSAYFIQGDAARLGRGCDRGAAGERDADQSKSAVTFHA